MVFAASQLESKHGGDGGSHYRNYGSCMEHQCGEGGKAKNAGEGEVLPESIVWKILSLQAGSTTTDAAIVKLEQADYRARTGRSCERSSGKRAAIDDWWMHSTIAGVTEK